MIWPNLIILRSTDKDITLKCQKFWYLKDFNKWSPKWYPIWIFGFSGYLPNTGLVAPAPPPPSYFPKRDLNSGPHRPLIRTWKDALSIIRTPICQPVGHPGGPKTRKRLIKTSLWTSPLTNQDLKTCCHMYFFPVCGSSRVPKNEETIDWDLNSRPHRSTIRASKDILSSSCSQGLCAHRVCHLRDLQGKTLRLQSRDLQLEMLRLHNCSSTGGESRDCFFV
jgi:hypothetical protein